MEAGKYDPLEAGVTVVELLPASVADQPFFTRGIDPVVSDGEPIVRLAQKIRPSVSAAASWL